MFVVISTVCAVGAPAAVFTVGSGGAHATIQTAVDAAGDAGGDNEVHIAMGTYAEHVLIPNGFSSGALELTGGWNAAFTARVTEAAATVIDGTASGRCLVASPQGGGIVLEGLTFTRGASGTDGAVSLLLSGTATAEVRNCRFVGNTVNSTSSAAGYYTNIGKTNGGDTSCSGRVRLFDASGTRIGSTRTMTVPAEEWAQLNDVFALAGAGSHSVAYGVVEVTTAGGSAWFYGSVIDRITKDPTTVPMRHAVAAGTVLRLPAAAHISGVGGTPWRTTLELVNTGSASATVTLTFRSGATTVVRTATVAAGTALGWDDLLVGLFGYGSDASIAGSVELWADQPLAVAGRSYADKGVDGTYGQALPALAAGEGIGGLAPGVLSHLRKDGSFCTNLGVQNLGSEACQVRVTLFGDDGAQLGAPVTRTVEAEQWSQINDVFTEAGGGGALLAHAVIEVLTPGGRVWAYASVIDVGSRDPTTVPLARPWVIGPPVV